MFSHIIIRGPLGVGKTTIARELAKKLKAKYISIDEILEKNKLIKYDKEKIALESFLSVNRIILAEAKYARTIIDGNFYYIEQIEHLISLLGRSLVFTITAPVGLCTQRDRKRKNKYGEDAVRAVYRLVNKVKYGIIIDGAKRKEDIIKEIIDLMDS